MLRIGKRTIFLNPLLAQVWNADDNRRVAGATERLHRLIDLPLGRGAGGLIEQILTIVHVDHRVALLTCIIVWRQVDQNVTLIIQLRTVHLFEQAYSDDYCMLAHTNSSSHKTISAGTPCWRYRTDEQTFATNSSDSGHLARRFLISACSPRPASASGSANRRASSRRALLLRSLPTLVGSRRSLCGTASNHVGGHFGNSVLALHSICHYIESIRVVWAAFGHAMTQSNRGYRSSPNYHPLFLFYGSKSAGRAQCRYFFEHMRRDAHYWLQS